MTNLKPGDTCYFGRPQGEKTLCRVLHINAKSVKVEQLEARGGHPVGSKWRVAPSFVTPAPGAIVPLPAPMPPKPKRSEEAIMKAIRGIYANLSPENLHCDGEISRAVAARRGAALRAALRVLFVELGRVVTEDEAYAYRFSRVG
jgi:hypothetical protein